MNAEAQNHVPSRYAVINHRFDRISKPPPVHLSLRDPAPKCGGEATPSAKKSKRPILNVPPGSLVYTGVINRIKLHNPLVGRLMNYRDLVTNGLLHRWGWAIYTVFALVVNFLYNYLFGRWVVRRQMSPLKMLRTVKDALTCNTSDRYALRLLRDRPDVRVVITGHSHEWRHISAPRGTYINTGSWSMMFSLEFPRFTLTWGKWRWLELIWRALVHLVHTGELRLVAEITLALFALMAVAGLAALLYWQSWLAFAVITAAYLLLTALVRSLAVQPTVVPRNRYTFAVVKHFAGGGLRVGLKEFRPSSGDIRECV
jgi:hypothetical protein